jgi:hypothetical protein
MVNALIGNKYGIISLPVSNYPVQYLLYPVLIAPVLLAGCSYDNINLGYPFGSEDLCNNAGLAEPVAMIIQNLSEQWAILHKYPLG